MAITEAQLVRQFRRVLAERMQGLAICNPRLSVEAVGFRDQDGQKLGILITPWFMNLALLPGSDETAGLPTGSLVTWTLEGGQRYEFNLYRDDELGDYLMAVLFRTTADFPDQDTARRVAQTVMKTLSATPPSGGGATLSRRDLLTGLGSA